MGKKTSEATVATYYTGMHFVLCHGPIDKVTAIQVNEQTAWMGSAGDSSIYINAPYLFGGNTKEGGIVGGVDIALGKPTQGRNPYLANLLGAIPAFRGVVSAFLKDVCIGTNYYMKPWAFMAQRIHVRKNGIPQWQDSLSEVVTQTTIPSNMVLSISYAEGLDFATGTTTVHIATVTTNAVFGLAVGMYVTISGSTDPIYNGTFLVRNINSNSFSYYLPSIPSYTPTRGIIVISYGTPGLINAVHVVRDCLTDTTWGLGNSESMIDEASFLAAAQTCYNEGLGFSFFWSQETPINDFITEVMTHIQGSVYEDRKTALWKINLTRKLSDTTGLLSLNETNIKQVNNLKLKQLGELASNVTVKFQDNVTGKSGSYTATDSALFQRQSASIDKTITYSGVATIGVAQKLAIRDLQQLGTPIYTCSITCDRTAENLNIGDAFNLTWPKYLDATITMRVISIDLGTSTKGAITIEAAQDVFSAPTVVYGGIPSSAWIPPINNPVPVVYRVLEEMPYYFLAVLQGDTFAQGVADTSSYIIEAAASPTNDSIDAGFWSTAGGAYVRNGTLHFCFTATLGASLSRTDTSISLVDPQDPELLPNGSIIQVGTELMLVTTVTAGTLTVVRGVCDTIPVTHAIGDRIYGIGSYAGTDQIEYLLSEVVSTKLTTVTPKGELALSDASGDSMTIYGRLHMPYPPANVKVNTTYWPANMTSGTSNLVIAWASRNRIQQTTAPLVGYYEASVTSEVGVTYSGRLVKISDSSVIDSFTGETGLTRTLNPAGYIGQVRLELWSVRGTFNSLQTVTHTFNLT